MKDLTKEELLALPNFSLISMDVDNEIVIWMIHREYGDVANGQRYGIPAINLTHEYSTWLEGIAPLYLLYNPREDVGEPPCKCITPANHIDCAWLAWRRG